MKCQKQQIYEYQTFRCYASIYGNDLLNPQIEVDFGDGEKRVIDKTCNYL